MKKKTIFTMLFCLIISVCVLFTGCGETDLSDINAQIQSMQQQITDLQNRLDSAENNQQDMLIDLTTAKGKLLTLEEKFYGKENNYYKLNDKITYSVNGVKLFDITPVVSVYLTSYVIGINTNSNINNTTIDSEIFNFTPILYNTNTCSSIKLSEVKKNTSGYEGYGNSEYVILINGSYSNDDYILFLYSNNNLFGLVKLNFALLS